MIREAASFGDTSCYSNIYLAHWSVSALRNVTIVRKEPTEGPRLALGAKWSGFLSALLPPEQVPTSCSLPLDSNLGCSGRITDAADCHL